MTSQDWAAWIGAIGTAGATLIAAITLAREAWWRRKDKRKEQAARIAAWVLTSQKSEQKNEDVIRICNRSFSPVYQCVATFTINEGDGHHPPKYYRILSTNCHHTSPGRMAAWCSQGVAGNVRSPWHRDSLHRRARRTLDTKHCGSVE